MNHFNVGGYLFRTAYRIGLHSRRLNFRSKSGVFGAPAQHDSTKIGKIYVINLDRRPDRWNLINSELQHIKTASGDTLFSITERMSATDGRLLEGEEFDRSEIQTTYSLRDQLLVEPQPRVMLEKIDLDTEVEMTRQEIAVALSHIRVWKEIVAGDTNFNLILEDDVYFKRRFPKSMKSTWEDLRNLGEIRDPFDLLYLSYVEVKGRAEKSDLTDNIFVPHRGLWCLSGYVLSKTGAEKLLSMLPVRGPVDLWINHQFRKLKVFGASKPLINQRLDFQSSNSYSILPVLAKIGALANEGPAVFELHRATAPVFAYGDENCGLTSLAMALSMLGYRCCSDLERLPDELLAELLDPGKARMFNAYVNIGSLENEYEKLALLYPEAKFIRLVPDSKAATEDALQVSHGCRVLTFSSEQGDGWKVLCEFLQCPPPASSYPELPDVGQRLLAQVDRHSRAQFPKMRRLTFDTSPWITSRNSDWTGIPVRRNESEVKKAAHILTDNFISLGENWESRMDTFPSNLALFSPENVFLNDAGTVLLLKKEPMGVRNYSGASISTKQLFHYGKFEAKIRPAKTPGVITGVFLHRNSPRQEIDIEFLGKDTTKLLVNVYYNPGDEGAMFDYGYRGSPMILDLGFDASEKFHKYGVQWTPDSIRWYVDDRLVHERLQWEPTPVPHLAMSFHINIWPSRSVELAGKLKQSKLPARSFIQSVKIES